MIKIGNKRNMESGAVLGEASISGLVHLLPRFYKYIDRLQGVWREGIQISVCN